MPLTRTLFKQAREQRGLTTTQAGELLGMDGSLVSRIENGIRQPTRAQLLKLADLYQLDRDRLVIEWLSDRIVRELEGERLGREILKAAELKLST